MIKYIGSKRALLGHVSAAVASVICSSRQDGATGFRCSSLRHRSRKTRARSISADSVGNSASRASSFAAAAA